MDSPRGDLFLVSNSYLPIEPETARRRTMTAEITAAEAGPAPSHEVKSSALNPGGDVFVDSTTEADQVVEKRLIRKLDQRLVVLAFLCCICIRTTWGTRAWANVCHVDLAAFLDRSNIGNAQTAGMGDDLGYNEEQYDVSVCQRVMLLNVLVC